MKHVTYRYCSIPLVDRHAVCVCALLKFGLWSTIPIKYTILGIYSLFMSFIRFRSVSHFMLRTNEKFNISSKVCLLERDSGSDEKQGRPQRPYRQRRAVNEEEQIIPLGGTPG